MACWETLAALGFLSAVLHQLAPGTATAGQIPKDSCVGRCGSWAEDCWCDEECVHKGNCCSDYQTLCGVPCPKCDGWSCDEWIQWSPKQYSCKSLEEQWGCNCTGCKSCGGPGPRPSPTPPAKLKLLAEPAYPEARCLDGSMAGYYFRNGNASRFLIYLEGGGWCYDQDCSSPTDAGTLGDCSQRSKGRLGSSRGWWPTHEWLTGCLSADPVQNPFFHDWTLVYVPYCDGTSFSGNTFRDGLHFRGRAILSAVVEDLKAHTEIQDATQVILSGGSAGASAVFYHIDSVAEELALNRGELVGLPDSGFFLDLKDKDGIDCWPAQMRSMIQASNGTAALHKGCLARYPEETWKCLFPEYFGDLISSRMLVINSLYDSSEVTYTLRLGCCPGGCGGRRPACAGRDLKLFYAMRQQHLKAWAPLVNRSGNGVWAPACQSHVVATDHWADASWEVPAGSGNTLAAVVRRWLAAAAGPAVRRAAVYEDAVAWPLNGPCASALDSFEEVI